MAPTAAAIADHRILSDLRRPAQTAPAWHDAHSPLHTRLLVQVPIAGRIMRLPTEPLTEHLRRRDARALRGHTSVRVLLTATPERRGTGHTAPDAHRLCLPEDPITLQVLRNGLRPLTVTLPAADLNLPELRLDDPAPKGELELHKARPMTGTVQGAPGDGMADLCMILGQAARRAMRRLTGRS